MGSNLKSVELVKSTMRLSLPMSPSTLLKMPFTNYSRLAEILSMSNSSEVRPLSNSPLEKLLASAWLSMELNAKAEDSELNKLAMPVHQDLNRKEIQTQPLCSLVVSLLL